MKTEELRSLLLGIISDYPEKACWTVSMAHLKILVDKAVKTEREACAKACDVLWVPEEGFYHWIPDSRSALQSAAEAIRARSEK
jgi:hypothetical protein